VLEKRWKKGGAVGNVLEHGPKPTAESRTRPVTKPPATPD